MSEKDMQLVLWSGMSDEFNSNEDYRILKKEFDELCDEQESLYRKDFEPIFRKLQELDNSLYLHNPCIKDDSLIDKAFGLSDRVYDKTFIKNFKRYNELFVIGKKTSKKRNRNCI